MIKNIIFSPYKCFAEELSINPPRLVNLIIGRNNSGKSSFLDYIYTLYTRKEGKNKSFSSKICFEICETLLPQFSVNLRQRFYGYGQIDYKNNIIGKSATLSFGKQGNSLRPSFVTQSLPTSVTNTYSVSVNNIDKLFEELIPKYDGCFKISAERDINSEEKDNDKAVNSNGDGLVSKLFYHINHNRGERRIKKNILKGINELLEGESHFSDFLVVENDNGDYEIKLALDNDQEIALSEMGSGLKTLIFVLFVLNSRVLLKEKTILMFEELENNLHPRIQRRLFEMIYKYAKDNNCPVFITSHSNVAINVFYDKDDAVIYHVISNGNSSTIKTVETKSGERDIADDLGIKASDIFQSNGIIWVEGPSDRIYLNKWINLIDPNLKENVNYTFLYYGGRLLSHYTASEEEQQDFIDILLTNKNSAILMDSDIKEEGKTINATKQRIVDEFSKNNSFCWVTEGREIENYIHEDVVNRKYPDNKRERIGIYSGFKDYIATSEPSFESNKVQFAKSLSFNLEDLDILDLREKVNELVNAIRKWNS